MGGYIHQDFLLDTEVARDLYHNHAAHQPIVDYHCHLSPRRICENSQFRSMSEAWLEGDRYKWRAMRANGIAEKYITGDASDWEKFQAWAATVPYALRNPLYHWTHLELAFPFRIDDRLLGADSAREIYDRCNVQLAEPEFTPQGLLKQFNVAVVCTTDDPVDSLEYHQKYKDQDAAKHTKMLPTWRPDRAFQLDEPGDYNKWLDRLAEASGVDVNSYEALLEALDKRQKFFHDRGCRLSDHGLLAIPNEECSTDEAETIFQKVRGGKRPAAIEQRAFQTALLHELAVMDHARGWVQQFHLGALRNTNTRQFLELGPDMGFDSIGDVAQGQALVAFLDRLDSSKQLASTILYNLNPRDNELFATLAGSFQDSSVPGKIQYGAAWWFLDQLDGMERHINTLSNMGLLSRFVGMLTDSRSFLSYSRHDYFRRLLCNILGNDVRRGLLPYDRGLLGWLVQRICFKNARRYFDFGLE